MSEAGRNPFSLRSALLLVLGGSALFVALLWMIGAGMTGGSTNDGGGHAGGKGLNGFAGFVELVESQGRQVTLSRSDSAAREAGLLVLTPPHQADAAEIARLVNRHRRIGPTLVVTQKWVATPIPASARPKDAKDGWVVLSGATGPNWPGFLDDVGVAVAPVRGGPYWRAQGFSGSLPAPAHVLSGSGRRLVPLVEGSNGEILAAYIYDGGHYSGLEARALERPDPTVKGQGLYPLVVVFEPDLIDNYGLAKQENARLALALVDATTDGEAMPVMFDLTLNGHARASNLLTLAFTPPFLAATLCLLLAALVIGWRAFVRFGPPRKATRAIAFGKSALVANTAGFMRRTRRLHLVTVPYADRIRTELTRALGLARQPTVEQAESAIDRALAARAPDDQPFSRIATRLRNAGSIHQAVTAARELHALERKLTR
ncbi:MAG: DUF4350 domain-containing protein [Novosphingobium sp.]|nr:DUF4350 domain-containing protein [Novosphingobium sp.]